MIEQIQVFVFLQLIWQCTLECCLVLNNFQILQLKLV